jgi:hypothetical protein
LVEPGATETWGGELDLCVSGLHYCVRPLDALAYTQGALIRRVRVSGDILQPEDEDTGCATVRQELWRADVTTLLHEFACDVTEQALDRVEKSGGRVDPRSREAIAVKRRWLRGAATDAELNAAWAAAWDAARVAAGAAVRAAAWVAAWVAAGVAAWDAAGVAAGVAAWVAVRAAAGAAAGVAAGVAAWDAVRAAAGDAAWDADWETLNADLEQRLLTLPEARGEAAE